MGLAWGADLIVELTGPTGCLDHVLAFEPQFLNLVAILRRSQ